MTAEAYLPDSVVKYGMIKLDEDLVLIKQPYFLSSLWYKFKLFVFGGKYYLKDLEDWTYEQVCVISIVTFIMTLVIMAWVLHQSRTGMSFTG